MYPNHKGRRGTVVHTGEIIYPPGAARRSHWSGMVTLNLDPLPGEKEENYKMEDDIDLVRESDGTMDHQRLSASICLY